MKPKILFNSSTNVVGGGVKNSAIFIKYALMDSFFDWEFAISPQIKSILVKWGISCEGTNFLLFNESPARNLESKLRLKDLVEKNKYALVYTMAGPAYINFSTIHVMGISNAFITHADWDAFSLMKNFFYSIRYIGKSFVQLLYSRKADYFIFQTEQARNSYCKRAIIPKNKTFIVTNAFDDSLVKIENDSFSKTDIFRIFCPGADYIHKGFQFIPSIAKAMKRMGKSDFKFNFILTLPEGKLWNQIKNKADDLGVSENIVNRGAFNYSEVCQVYNEADLVFVPSLLETFSASYLEAISFQKKLVVSDKDFAREICNGYAEYVNPKNPVQTAEILLSAMQSKDVDISRTLLGKSILKKFGNQTERFEKIRQIISQIVESKKGTSYVD